MALSIALRVTTNFIAQRWQRLPASATEPKEPVQFECFSIKPDPDDAARWLQCQLSVYLLDFGLGRKIARFELDVAEYPFALDHNIVTSAVRFCPKDLNLTYSFPPQASKEFANEQMFEDFLSGTGIAKIGIVFRHVWFHLRLGEVFLGVIDGCHGWGNLICQGQRQVLQLIAPCKFREPAIGNAS
jgi:hypothetical protein